jgi:hypothetical protein
MINLQPNLILRRAPNIKVFINSSSDIKILIKNNEISCGKFALSVLDAFSYPISVSDALKVLQTRVIGVEDWINLTSTITQLYNSGVLIDESQINSIISTNPYGFDSGLIHTMMLNDRVRTSTFLAGIREIVRPGDVVVDIGTGTGILAIAAAHAGAKHVYAIEATEIGKTALSLFEANGLADKITLIQGWSTQISLPEPADVLVAEIIGNEPLGEKVLETTIDARKRLLNPEARMIPGRLKIFGLPVNIPSDELIKRGFTQEALKSWQDWYGINFSPIGMVINESPQSFPIKPQKARDWNIIADPILLADIDFRTVKQSMIDHTVDAIANTSGNLNGLLIYFELELSPNTHLSTHPAIADKDNHWSSLVWISTQSLILQKGDSFQVTYRYRVPGTQNKVLITRD